MSSENWHEERIRLTAQLKALVSGGTTHFDKDETGQRDQETTGQAIDRIRARLAELEGRLGAEVDQPPPAQNVGDNSPNPLPNRRKDEDAAESGGDPGRSA